MSTRILVTGGTGLVGNAIKNVIETEEKQSNEEWFYVGSKEADLTWVKFSSNFHKLCNKISIAYRLEIWIQHVNYLININQIKLFI